MKQVTDEEYAALQAFMTKGNIIEARQIVWTQRFANDPLWADVMGRAVTTRREKLRACNAEDEAWNKLLSLLGDNVGPIHTEWLYDMVDSEAQK